MAYHFIAIKSDFRQGLRIAWHYSSITELDSDKVESFMKRATAFNDGGYGIHKLVTDSLSWQSVVEKDSFFKDIFAISDMDEFFKTLGDDEEVTAVDIAKLITTSIEITHLKLQKLLYLCYAEYMIKFEEKLFDEKIVAYKYGPVVEEVYHTFKEYRYSEITSIDDDETVYFYNEDVRFNPIFMKVLGSKHGIDKALTILDTIKKYTSYSANQLVDLTHKKDSPWDKVYVEGWNKVITDDIILDYHVNEIN